MKDSRTQEEKQAIFEAVLADMESGMSCMRATEKNGVKNSTFTDWINGQCFDDPCARAKYKRAQESRADRFADQMIDIVMSPPEKNEFGVDRGDVDLRRVKMDALKWIAGRMSRRYSEKAHDDVVQDNQSGPITIVFEEAVKP